MKKSILILLLLALCCSFCACGAAETPVSDGEVPALSGERDVSEIPEAVAREIRQTYYDSHRESMEDLTPDDVTIRDFYGEYHGAYAVVLSGAAVEYPGIVVTEKINGLSFVRSFPSVEIYRDGKLYGLKAAFDEGVLSVDDLQTLHETYKAAESHLYKEEDDGATDGELSQSTEGLQWVEKIYCTATVDDSFAEDKVILLLKEGTQYTVSDFADAGCVSLETWEEFGEPIVELTLNTDSKQEILEAIRRLEQRDEVIAADPAYTVPVPLSRRVADEEELLETVNSFSGVETPFTMEKTVPLKSVTYPEGYYYVLCDLAPHGWAVLTEDGRLMMGQFLGGDPPELDENTDYYYVGINEFAVEKDGCLYLPGSETPLSRKRLQSEMASEARSVLPYDGWSIRAESFDGLPIPFAPEE